MRVHCNSGTMTGLSARPPPRSGSNDNLHNQQLRQTWNEFNRALRSTQPFNPLTWILRLSRALLSYVYRRSGCVRIVARYELHKVWRPVIPMFAVALVVLVALAYFTSMRSVVKQQWCCDAATADPAACESESCSWMWFHDFLVVYFSFMVLFHYLLTTFQSPGVALPATPTRRWLSMESQGGMLGCNPVRDDAAERKRVDFYGQLPSATELADLNAICRPVDSSNVVPVSPHPSPNPSYCDKCDIVRPARCRHCSTCNRCILQFDHHCAWLNNCIGYNNYRSFLLILFFIMTGCWYGTALLFYPFYEPLRAQIKEFGFRLFYTHGTGFLDLPPIMKMLGMLWTGQGLKVKVVIDMVYPLLCGVGACISIFFGTHLSCVLKARTSLEHRISLDHIIGSLRSPRLSSRTAVAPNPFDQGWYKNLQQVLGPNLFLILLPIPVRTPPPFVPKNRQQ